MAITASYVRGEGAPLSRWDAVLARRAYEIYTAQSECSVSEAKHVFINETLFGHLPAGQRVLSSETTRFHFTPTATCLATPEVRRHQRPGTVSITITDTHTAHTAHHVTLAFSRRHRHRSSPCYRRGGRRECHQVICPKSHSLQEARLTNPSSLALELMRSPLLSAQSHGRSPMLFPHSAHWIPYNPSCFKATCHVRTDSR